MKRIACILVFLIFVSGAFSQEANVRARLEPATGQIWVGQQVTLVIELLSPGYFSGAPVFDFPNVAGLLIVPPTDHPTLSAETAGGISYSVQHYEVTIYPRRASGFDIPKFEVRFHIKLAALDKNSEPETVTVGPLHLAATMPPGAENLGTVISARDLKVDDQWKPTPANAKVGAAFTRTITFSAPGVPGMVFPPFVAHEIDGLGIYPNQPQVLDQSNRGELTGIQRDVITYICQRPGKFWIPAARLTWFDLAAQKLQTVDLAARDFEVAPNPAMERAARTAVRHRHFGYVAWIVIACAILIVSAFLIAVRLRNALLAPFRAVHLAPLNPRSLSNP
jgi:hypothetical protein